MGMNLPCGPCGDGKCDKHTSIMGFARLREERDALHARVAVLEAALRGITRAYAGAVDAKDGERDNGWQERSAAFVAALAALATEPK